LQGVDESKPVKKEKKTPTRKINTASFVMKFQEEKWVCVSRVPKIRSLLCFWHWYVDFHRL